MLSAVGGQWIEMARGNNLGSLQARLQMKKGFEIVGRGAFALAFALIFLGICYSISVIPDLARGPLGFKNVTPSLLTRMLLVFLPQPLFCLLEACFVFVIGFRLVGRAVVTAPRLITLIVGAFISAAAVILRELAILHGTFPVEEPPPNWANVAFNCFVLLIIIGCAWRQGAQKRLGRS